MKLIHMSDLHIGKRVNGFSMVEDQKYILEKMTDIVKNESPDACSSPEIYMIKQFLRRRQSGFWMIS